MKVTLIYPAISVKERYGTDIGDIGGKQAPLGILYLSSWLKQKGHETQFIDAEASSLSEDEIISLITEFRPEVVCISITTVAWNNSLRLSRTINEAFPEIKIIAGGPHITANPEESLKNDSIFAGIIGEGENTLIEVLEKVESKEDITDIPGIVYSNADGKIKISEKREHIKDLDKLPYPDREILPEISIYRPPIGCYRKSRIVSIITSRGCPYRCVFCDNNTFGRKIRYFSAEYVIGEIEYVIEKYKAQEISFLDDTFPSNRKRFRRILELIIDKDLGIVWTCMANINDLDSEILELMKRSGCWQIAVGIESGNDEILKTIKKSINLKNIKDRLTEADRIGIQIKGFFMMGNPKETKDTLRKTTDLALSLPLTDVTCTIVTPIKGTELYEMASSGKYGKFDASADSSQLNYWEPVFLPTGLTEEDLYKAQRDFFKTFYIRPGIIIKQLKKIRNMTILFRMLKTVFKIVVMKPKA